MTLREKQALFARLLARLIYRIYAAGHEVTLGEGYIGDSIDKPGEDTPHRRTGLHFMRLAQDLNLFYRGEYRDRTEHWAPFGEWWEAQDPLCRWGGRFGDGNHFSLTHDGKA